DVEAVGMIGLGRRPELARARKRTALQRVELSAGKALRVVPAFFDVTDGLDVERVREVLASFGPAGVGSVAVAEAFSPDDPRNEQAVVELAQAAGLPACASTELSGLY